MPIKTVEDIKYSDVDNLIPAIKLLKINDVMPDETQPGAVLSFSEMKPNDITHGIEINSETCVFSENPGITIDECLKLDIENMKDCLTDTKILNTNKARLQAINSLKKNFEQEIERVDLHADKSAAICSLMIHTAVDDD